MLDNQKCIEKIFYASRELEQLKEILCANGGKKYNKINYLVLEIDNILDDIKNFKKEFLCEQNSNGSTSNQTRINPSPEFMYEPFQMSGGHINDLTRIIDNQARYILSHNALDGTINVTRDNTEVSFSEDGLTVRNFEDFVPF